MSEPANKVAKKDGTSRKPRKEKPRALRSIAPTSIPSGMRRALPAGPGEPLPHAIVMRLGERYGHDFSAVRLHRDAGANDAAADFGAKAYTVGTHLVFAKDRFAPGTPEGERLIAHELAHVVQQSRGGASPPIDSSAAHEHAARDAALRTEISRPDAGTVAVAGSTSIGVARDEDEKKRVQQTPKLLPPGPPAPKQLSPGPVTVDQVMSDPTAVQQFNTVAAGSARNVKDITNVQGAIFEEVMNREIDRRIGQRSGLQELMPGDVDVSKLKFVDPKTDPAKLQPGEAMFVRGDRIKGDVDGKQVKLSDGMILIGEKKGIRVVTVFEGKSGERRASDLHRTESGKEDPTPADAREKAQVRKESPKNQKVIESELGGQIRKTIERLSPQEGDNATTIQIDGRSVSVRASAKRTRYLGVVPSDVDISSSQEHLVKREGVNFAPLKLASSEGDIKVAASRVAEKAQAGKPWPLPAGKKDKSAAKSPADKQAAAAAKQQAAAARQAAAAQKAAAAQQAADARKAAAAKKAAAKQQAAAARQAAAAQKATAKKTAAPKPSAAKKAPSPAATESADQSAIGKPVPTKVASTPVATTVEAASPAAPGAKKVAVPTAPSTDVDAAPGMSKPPGAPAPATPTARPAVQAAPPAAEADAIGKPPTAVKVVVPGNSEAVPSVNGGTSANAAAPSQPAIKPGATGARPAAPPRAKAPVPAAPTVAAGPKGGVRTIPAAQPRLPAGGAMPSGDLKAGAAAAAGSIIELIAVPIINHYLQEHYAERYAEHARKKIAEALERDKPKFEEAIKRAHREIEEAQAEGKSVSLHVELSLDWQDTADRDPFVGTGISSGSILMNVTVVDIQVVHEGQKPKPYYPPLPEGFVANVGEFAKFALKNNMGMADTYEGVDLELEGTNAEGKRIREIDQALKTAAPDSDEAKKLIEERSKINETYSEFIKQRQAKKAAETARAKAAEDKRNKERLDQVLAADKAKRDAPQQMVRPLLPPPGGLSLPISQPVRSIGPFDVSGEVTPHERGELIAARFEQKKEEWVAYAKKIEAKYNAGALDDEERVRFRNARDAWITSLNNYAAAMGKEPAMHSGHGRLKAVQDWLANDGHNALLIGM